MKAILSILKGIAAVLSWFFSDKQVKKRELRSLDKKLAEQEKAIRTGDVDAVNKRVQELMRNARCWFLLACLGLGLCAVAAHVVACRTVAPTCYVSSEERVARIDHEGKPGWWVPDAVFNILMTKATLWDEQQKKGTETP